MNPSHLLSPEQIAGLLRLLDLTRDAELTCGEFQLHAAEYAERERAGRPRDGAMPHVAQHLTVCPECREEYEALRRVLAEELQ